jgi:hypothetical protein
MLKDYFKNCFKQITKETDPHMKDAILAKSVILCLKTYLGLSHFTGVEHAKTMFSTGNALDDI